MNRKHAVLLLIVIAFILTYSFAFTGYVTVPERETIPPTLSCTAPEYRNISGETVHVTRVIDGDTIVIEGNERVRLLGIDTPEQGQVLFAESAAFLRNMVDNKSVILERDVTNRDKYNRLLRHVFLNGTHINCVLIKSGFAKTLVILPDEKYSEHLREAEHMAQQQQLGIWQYETIPDVFCVGISQFRYNAWGNDNENLNGEFVTFRNFCTYPVDMTNWVIHDERGTTFTFPCFIAQNKTRFTLYTGAGSNNETALYWNNGWPVWNNDGDTLKLLNPSGTPMLDYSY